MHAATRTLGSPSTAAALAALLLAAPGARAQCDLVVFSEDFEGGLPAGWSAGGDWVVTDSSPCSITCQTGKYAYLGLSSICDCPPFVNVPMWSICKGDLLSAPIQLPELAAGESLRLDFCADTYINGGCVQGLMDCNRVQVEAGTHVKAFAIGSHNTIFNTCPPPWNLPPYDISEFRGEEIRLRWTPGCYDPEGRVRILLDNVEILRGVQPPASYCATAPNSVGAGARMDSVGAPSVSTNAFSLVASDAPPGQLGLFFFGFQQTQVPFGNGWLCVSGGVFRLPPAVPIDAAGVAVRPLDLLEPPALGKLVPGAVADFQFWYRDPAAGGATFNLTDGLEVRFCQ